MLAPVVIFTFNRLDHTKKTVEALVKNNLAKETEVFIYSDGARNTKENEKVYSVRKYLKTISGFKNITIFESDKNRGLANSVISGVSEIINKYEAVIVLEDDLITSQYFLEYMNKALRVYKERKDIWSISGYGPNISIPFSYKDEIYITKRGCSWGWATWKDRWTLNDWYIKDWNDFKKDRIKIKYFNETGSDMSYMLEDQMKGRIDSWAIRWVYNQFKYDMWTVYPTKSFIKNIGTDLSGTHSSSSNKYEVVLADKKIELNSNITKNSDIGLNFKKFYNLNLLQYIAVFIKKIGLYKPVRKLRNIIIMKLKKCKINLMWCLNEKIN